MVACTIPQALDNFENSLITLKCDLAWRDSIHKQVWSLAREANFKEVFSNEHSRKAMEFADFVLKGVGSCVEISDARKSAEIQAQLFAADMAIHALTA